MRIAVRSLAMALLVGAAVAVGSGVRAGATAVASTPHVTIVDNDGGFMPIDPGTGLFGYAPTHIQVTQGESIVFDNPASNKRPHTVTSITWSGGSFARTLESGTKFNSSPAQDSLLMPGGTFTLDTSSLDPGHYVYYCTLHPWMTASFTVAAP